MESVIHVQETRWFSHHTVLKVWFNLLYLATWVLEFCKVSGTSELEQSMGVRKYVERFKFSDLDIRIVPGSRCVS